MPSLYVDGGMQSVIREQQKRLKRERAGADERPDDVYVSEREAVYALLSEKAKRKVDKKRDDE